MRLAFMVDAVATEADEMATTRLARAASRMGHETWYVGVGDVELAENGELAARAYRAVFEADDSLTTFIQRIQESDAERIVMDDLDALFLRNESITDWRAQPWAGPIGSVVGQMLQARGVTVVNDPTTLIRAASKIYLEEFPEKIRPRAIVTRDPAAIKRFVGDVGKAVVKPLYGGKGRKVFIVGDKEEPNLGQITEAVLEDGYAIAQEYVDGAEDGDVRIFVLGGQILEHEGRPAAFRRVPQGSEMRANISKGGKMEPVEVTGAQRAVIDTMREKLDADGMFFVGIDMVGDKVLEINADSPGAIQSIEWLYKIDICPTVIDALERRTLSSP